MSKETMFVERSAAFRRWFEEGKRRGATHVIYGFMQTGENQYFPEYVMPGKDAREQAEFSDRFDLFWGQYDVAHFVFNLSRPFEEQLAQTKGLTQGLGNFSKSYWVNQFTNKRRRLLRRYRDIRTQIWLTRRSLARTISKIRKQVMEELKDWRTC